MTKQERAIFNSCYNSGEFRQYRCNHTQTLSERPFQPQQASAKTDDTEIWFWILGTIGFCALFIMKMLW